LRTRAEAEEASAWLASLRLDGVTSAAAGAETSVHAYRFMSVPDTYYEAVDSRVPEHGDYRQSWAADRRTADIEGSPQNSISTVPIMP
jgi:hypothetical protein